jgi:hypothetical protein
VLGRKKGLSCRPYYRSCDFIAPSQANGCAMACSYCYVARRKGYANPITTFVNIEEISASVERHAARQGMKFEETQADPEHWVYELGTNSDLSVDAAVGDNVRDLIALFRAIPTPRRLSRPSSSTGSFWTTTRKVGRAYDSRSCRRRFPGSWT